MNMNKTQNIDKRENYIRLRISTKEKILIEEKAKQKCISLYQSKSFELTFLKNKRAKWLFFIYTILSFPPTSYTSPPQVSHPNQITDLIFLKKDLTFVEHFDIMYIQN